MKTRKTELPNLASDIRKLVGVGDELPPVESWNPEHEGEIDIRIAEDGSWFYQGKKMERASIPQLFSRILRRDGDDYFLVTPHEKLKIVVDQAPFIIRLMDVEGKGQQQIILFSTNVGDSFVLSQAHPMQVQFKSQNEPMPYVLVRRNLMALISRPVYYELAGLVTESAVKQGIYGVWSDGDFFEM